MPRRSSGRMGQRNNVAGDGASPIPGPELERKLFSHHVVEAPSRDELLNGQFSHRQDQPGLKNFNLTSQPRGAIGDFVRRGNTIASRGVFSRKTSADSRHVNRGPEGRFVHPAGFFEPAEQCFSRCPRKRLSGDGLLVARRLADKKDLARHRSAADHRGLHPRAAPTKQKPAHVRDQLPRREGGGGFPGRRNSFRHPFTKGHFAILKRIL